VLVDLQQPGQGGLVPGKYRGHPAIAQCPGESQLEHGQVIGGHEQNLSLPRSGSGEQGAGQRQE
jgi:hypothetical protein